MLGVTILKTYNQVSYLHIYTASFRDEFSPVESSDQFAHLLRHTVFFRAKNSSVNEIEL
jgi:hypothetical protein